MCPRHYSGALADVAIVPVTARGSSSVWAQYTIRLPQGRRDVVAAALKRQGIPTAVYYPISLHRQQHYRRFPVADGGAPVSELLADEVIRGGPGGAPSMPSETPVAHGRKIDRRAMSAP